MADKRPNESIIGNPGRLEYYPPDVQRAKDRGWLTTRNHENNVPQIKELTAHSEWLAPEPEYSPSASGQDIWHENQKQKKWLLKSHPEAALGNDELEDLLANESSTLQASSTSPWQLTQFAVGEMADTMNPQQVRGAPLLATAAGSAGDILRIARPASDVWCLEESGDSRVRMLEYVKHQETLWTKDIGTIRCIKAIVSTKKYEPVRWLAVQRDFGTSVFRPEYQKIPVVSETFSGTGPQAPTHIAPNLLFRITKNQTGCDFHCDVAFNPGIRSKPAQLAIVDQGGNWSIWDVRGTRNRTYKRPRASLYKCGNIRDGVLGRLPRKETTKPQWHKIFWVGHSRADDDDGSDEEDVSAAQAAVPFPPLERSSTLLLCNQKLLRLLDVDADDFLPELRIIPDGSKDLILDVQVDGRDPRYFYVATTSRIFVVAVFTSEDFLQQRTTRKAFILGSFPHLRDKMKQQLKLTVTAGPFLSAERTAVIVLYSQHSNWQDMFHITFSRRDPKKMVCHHGSLVSRSNLSESSSGGLQTLCVYPISLMDQQPPNPGSYAHTSPDHGATFFQLFSFGTDLSLSCCLGMSSNHEWRTDMSLIRKLTDAEVRGSSRPLKSEKLSREEIERQGAVRFLSARFVVADSVAEFRYKKDFAVAGRSAVGLQTTTFFSRMVAPVMETFRASLTALWAEAHGSAEFDVHGDAPFDPVFIALQEALETRSFPRRLISEMVQQFRIPEDYRETSREWETEIEQLRHADPALQITDLEQPRRLLRSGLSIEDMLTDLVGVTLGPNQSALANDHSNDLAFLILCRIACEIFLSRQGMAYLPLDILEAPQEEAADIRSSPPLLPDYMLMDTQESIRSTIRSSSLAPSSAPHSQASSRASTPASTAYSTATEIPENSGFALLKALTGCEGLPTQEKLPTAWDLGQDSSRTVFSIDKNEVTEGMRRRAKQEAREARKRKRAENLFRLQVEHNMFPSTQPAPKTSFYTQTSQPMSDFSSQPRVQSSAPPISMSQPVAGAFGRRADIERPRKKMKRKGGF